jgi:DNA-binding transcriptional regulator YiaG
MTPTQFKRTVKRLGLSQMELARRIKVDGRTVRSWIAGRYAVPEAVSLLLGCWQREQRKRK